MLRVTIDLVPYGIEDQKRTLTVGEIWNDATGTKTRGNYQFRLYAGNTKRVWQEGEIKAFPRKRLNSWYLLARVLVTALSGGKFPM